VSEVLIVTGPPGAGKSTVAAALVERRTPSVLVEGDRFFAFLEQGRIDPWLPESHEQNIVVGEAAASATACFAAGGFWTVYDGVVAPWSLSMFASERIDRLHYAVLLPDVERCMERVTTRVGHGFSDMAATRHMHAQFADVDIPERHLFRADATVEQLSELIMGRVTSGQILAGSDLTR
jgi:predicted ABC-type ATPase